MEVQFRGSAPELMQTVAKKRVAVTNSEMRFAVLYDWELFKDVLENGEGRSAFP